MGYAIKAGYVEREGVCYFVDDATSTRGIVFQPDVYTFAETIAELAGVNRIVDVGCGWADKLVALRARHHRWHYVGIDFGPNINRCRSRYSEGGTWIDHDLEQWLNFDGHDSIMICSDVVEHLADPRPLVRTLRDAGATAIVISTPERDIEYGADHNGPPPNPCHVREWNRPEFVDFLTGEGLTVRHAGLTRSDNRDPRLATLLVVCT